MWHVPRAPGVEWQARVPQGLGATFLPLPLPVLGTEEDRPPWAALSHTAFTGPSALVPVASAPPVSAQGHRLRSP